MTTFDDVLGYEKEKEDVRRLCDALKNKEKYSRLGARAPRGLVLYGPPGVGKTLMASAAATDIGRPLFLLRRDASEGDFTEKIGDAFREAEKAAPSVLILDDLDKYSDVPAGRMDAPEFTAVQTFLDGLEGDVFVIATVNEIRRIPYSLLRCGRLEERVFMDFPTLSDSEEIVAHYLEGKRVAADVNPSEVAEVMRGASCAALESALSEAAALSAFDGKEETTRESLIKTLLLKCDGIDVDASLLTPVNIERNSYHTAGRVVAYRAWRKDAVAFATVCPSNSGIDGRGCLALSGAAADAPLWKDVLGRSAGSLAGNAAYKIKFGLTNEHCGRTITGVVEELQRAVAAEGVLGPWLTYFESAGGDRIKSQNLNKTRLDATLSLAQKAYDEAEKILKENWDAVESVAGALRERLVLTRREIDEILEG